MPYYQAMTDIWSRLKAIGYDRDFVVSTILPEWWDDGLAETPSNRALAEMTIARQLGIPLLHLQNPTKKLRRPEAGGARLRKWSTAAREEVGPAVQISSRLAELIGLGMREAPAFQGLRDALAIRDAVFATSPTALVNLETLLNYCWQRGIPVAHHSRFPKLGKKIIGLAAIFANRPVIILASRRDALPWLAFDLAHELGHIALKHASAGKYKIDLETPLEAKEENEANDFAGRLLFGVENFHISSERWLKAPVLAKECQRLQQTNRMDAGLLIVNYARTMGQWAAAEAALKIVKQNTGAQNLIRSYFAKNFQRDGLPDSSLNFIAATTGVGD